MIEVDGLVRVLGDARVLDGLSFVAPQGSITGFLGPNGAGKTTTMRVLSTLLRPTEGTVRIEGHDVVKEPLEVRRVIGLVTEEPSLLDRLTVREQLVFNAKAYDLATNTTAERIELLVDLLGLHDGIDKRAGALSKGNRQKAALARALVHDPPVLLLDEPTANLDIVAQAGMQELLQRPDVVGGKTVFLSTHVLDEAERLCQRVVGIVGGRTVAEGTPAEIVERTGAATFRDAFLALVAETAMAPPPSP
ncbi:MAG: type transport system ATP-binding protein [Actinomycetota bacterium]|jgi:ABC-type multidrug transport system ATPase subunit|nr:type transport system ATP-binding protein [Actinomycetota bacterium]